MLDYTVLPTVNAGLNAPAGVLLTAGYIAIRSGRVSLHRACMIAAFMTSVVFLGSYRTYHLRVGMTPFQGQGLVRWVYFAILIPHLILAVAVVPFALYTLYRAVRREFARPSPHRPLDAAHLAVRVRHGRAGVPDALRLVSGGLNGHALTGWAGARLLCRHNRGC